MKFKLGFILTLVLSALLIFGCIVVLLVENIFSFIFSIIIPLLVVLNSIFLVFWLLRRRKRFSLSLLSLIIFFLCFNSFIQFNSEKKAKKEDAISVLTYNAKGFSLKFGISVGKEKQIVNFIKEQDADIVVFQEFSYFSLKYFDMYPYHFLGYREDVTKSLQIILSKYPIINKGYIDFPNTINNAMFADILYNNETIRIYNLHLESFRTSTMHQLNNPNSYSPLITRIRITEKIRKTQAELVNSHINLFDGKTIICGDFNCTQFSSTYNTLKESRKDTFVEAGLGFGTTYKLFNYPFRLDYVLADDNFEVISHQNFDLKLSDHEPVLTRLIVN